MASTVTLLSLRTQIRQRSDMVNSGFVTDSELNSMINLSVKKLYGKLVAANEEYYTISSTITTDGLTDTFSLPALFFKLVGVDYPLNGRQQPMERYSFQDRNRYTNNGQVLRYRVIKDSIVFKPVPAVQTITIWYVPSLVALSGDSDTFDGVNGWENYVIVDCAIICKGKEESDVQELLVEKQDIENEIESLKMNRDQGKPEVITDITNSKLDDRYYFGDDV